MEGTPITPITKIPSKGFSIGNFHWKNKYWFYIGGAAIGTYIIAHIAKQASLLKKTCFKPSGFVTNQLSLTNTDINLKLKMKNKSKIDYYLTNQIYNVYVNNQFVGSIKNPNRLYIPPEKTADVWLNLKFNPLKVANISWDTFKDLLSSGSDAKIQIVGNAKIIDRSGLFGFNYPVDSTFTLKQLTTSGASEPC